MQPNQVGDKLEFILRFSVITKIAGLALVVLLKFSPKVNEIWRVSVDLARPHGLDAKTSKCG